MTKRLMLNTVTAGSDRLSELLAKAAQTPMTPEMYEAQKQSFIRAEIGFGSDKDEQGYAAALLSGDQKRINRAKEKERRRIEAYEYSREVQRIATGCNKKD